MGRTRERRQLRQQERQQQRRDEETFLLGAILGKNATLERVLLGAIGRVLGLETQDAARIASQEPPGAVVSALQRLARSVWPERWKGALSGPLVVVMEDATETNAPILGSFDLANPRLADFFDGYVSELADNLSSTSYDNAIGVIREAQDSGLSVPDTSRLLREKLNELAPTRAERIARTELIRSSNGAALAQARESGIVTGKRYLATMDSRTRPEHRAMHDEEVPIDEPFSSGEMYAGEKSVNCRCTQTWVLSDAILGGAA